MRETEIINNFNNLIAKKIKENNLKIEASKIKVEKFFIGQMAKDSRLDFNITRDLDCIQDDFIYNVGTLYALRPYINNPLEEIINFQGKKMSTYNQNMFDSLYLMYASICYEKLYNFWDRIGDKIASEFPNQYQNKKNIFFANVIDNIEPTYLKNIHIDWLTNFRNSDFKDFNDRRIKIVHYEQLEARYLTSITKDPSNLNIISKIWKEKFSLPDYFKKHIFLTNKGILNTYNFIEHKNQ